MARALMKGITVCTDIFVYHVPRMASQKETRNLSVLKQWSPSNRVANNITVNRNTVDYSFCQPTFPWSGFGTTEITKPNCMIKSGTGLCSLKANYQFCNKIKGVMTDGNSGEGQ